jgi:hypothetical protein
MKFDPLFDHFFEPYYPFRRETKAKKAFRAMNCATHTTPTRPIWAGGARGNSSTRKHPTPAY